MSALRHKPFNHFAFTALLCGTMACNPAETADTPRPAAAHFSLSEYFGREALRLQQLDPQIHKTVSKNGDQERREIRVADWEKELELFMDSDINKPAWQSSYRADTSSNTITYHRTDAKLRTSEISVERHEDGTVRHIHVINKVDNMLYQTVEILDYYPDSLYQITKEQNVWIIGQSNYSVTGEWQ